MMWDKTKSETFTVGETVRAWDGNKGYKEGMVIRVYDENVYRKEHYTDKGMTIPEFDDASFNDVLVDIKFGDQVSLAHYASALKKKID